MRNLRGKVVAVAADCEVAAALARRLAKEGARIVLGSPASAEIEETLAELRWECATILWRPIDPRDPAALKTLADDAEAAFGAPDALVAGGPAPWAGASRTERLIRLAAGRGPGASDLRSDRDKRVTTIMTDEVGGSAVSADCVADAVIYALAGRGEVGSLVLRPLAEAA